MLETDAMHLNTSYAGNSMKIWFLRFRKKCEQNVSKFDWVFINSLDEDPDPTFVFGDFNFRLDQCKLLKVIIIVWTESLSFGRRCGLTCFVFSRVSNEYRLRKTTWKKALGRFQIKHLCRSVIYNLLKRRFRKKRQIFKINKIFSSQLIKSKSVCCFRFISVSVIFDFRWYLNIALWRQLLKMAKRRSQNWLLLKKNIRKR